MVKVEIVIPKMGEGIVEATVLNWLKSVGDVVEADDTLLEIATDKVDSDVPAPVSGKLVEILAEVNEVVPVGKVIAIIETIEPGQSEDAPQTIPAEEVITPELTPEKTALFSIDQEVKTNGAHKRIYSPLVRSIAKQEEISEQELAAIVGTGANGRVSKKDMMQYLATQKELVVRTKRSIPDQQEVPVLENPSPAPIINPLVSANGSEQVEEAIEMDRMRRMIADHMVMSKQTSPHVTCFLEVDVSEMVTWRDKNKALFQQQHGEKLTYTPLFVQAVAKTIKDYPLINVSVDGHKIIKKKKVNIGMATALPSGNLIVPVIKNADQMNLVGLASAVNDLASRARALKLKPEEIQGGTFTISNLGAFRIDAGTPIINQPQVAILALGNIVKKPAVVSTQIGDVIAIRHKMMLSLSFDHRVVDGYLGGTFLRTLGDYIEQFNMQPNT